jgi:hypothetical protein
MVEMPMRSLRVYLGFAALAVLAFVPSVDALAITATAPTAPLPFDGSVTIDVSVQTTCNEIINDNPSNQPMTRTLVAASDVSWLTVTGSEVSWTTDECDPNSASLAATCTPQPDCVSMYPTAQTTGTITIAPKPIAPALETATITVTVKDKEGSISFPITVSHYGSMNATTDRPKVPAGLGDKQPFNVTLDVNTNAVSTVQFTLTQPPTKGTIRGIDNVPISPNVAQLFEHHAGFFVWSDGGPDAGKPVSLKVPLQYESAATVWTADTATVEVRLVADKDPTLMSEPITLTWTFEPTVTQEPKGESPAPDLVVFLLVIGVVLILRMRRQS